MRIRSLDHTAAPSDKDLLEPDGAPELLAALARGRSVAAPSTGRAALERRSFLAAAGRQELAELERVGMRRRWQPGTVVVRQDDPAPPVVVVRRGHVALERRAGGRRVLLDIAGPEDVVGGTLRRVPAGHDALALDGVDGLVLSPLAWECLLATRPRIALALGEALHGRLLAADARHVEMATLATTARLARALLDLADRYGTMAADGVRVDLPLSQDQIASWIGASHKAVATAMRTLRAARAVRTHRCAVTVTSQPALRAIAAGAGGGVREPA